jgi:hypothetical protein
MKRRRFSFPFPSFSSTHLVHAIHLISSLEKKKKKKKKKKNNGIVNYEKKKKKGV